MTKKTVRKSIIIALLSLILTALILFTSAIFFMLLIGRDSYSEELIGQYVSPEKTYTVLVYRTNGGATTAFGIKCKLHRNDKKTSCNRIIYTEYRNDSAEVEWEDNDTVIINGKRIENVLKDRVDV